MAEIENIQFPKHSTLWKDLGYLGYKPDGTSSFELFKKPKGGELSEMQRAENKAISSVRIVVEHAIGGVKICRMLKEVIRIHTLDLRDKIVETCTALHNLRVALRPPYKINPIFL